MSKNYLIGLDLDGTLLNKHSKITYQTKKYLRKLALEGHKIILCSGRPLRAILPFYDSLKIDAPIVCYNGGHILKPYDSSFKEQKYAFDQNIIKNVITNIGLENIENIMCETNERIWVYKENDKLSEILWHDGTDIVYGDLTSTLNVDPISFLLYSSIKGFNSKIKEQIKNYDHLGLRFWNGYLKNFAEVYDKRISKYNALKYIAKYFNIPLKHIITFGDAENDVDMVKHSEFGFAMINAEDILKMNAKYITKYDNNHNGVIKELKAFFKTHQE